MLQPIEKIVAPCQAFPAGEDAILAVSVEEDTSI